MNIPGEYIVHESEHWIVNHHLTSRLPGYLMLGSRAPVDSLADLPDQALADMGRLMARLQRAMEQALAPKWLYIGRFGHVPGCPLHFHFIPVHDWVEALFWADERYRALQQFGSLEHALSKTDGAELTLFVWREFGESPTPPEVLGRGIPEVIAAVREQL
ncbi:HIT family protein [Pseudomonas sp. zfem004]|uniref:HIT family protein n=1 Tax=unclassified Pseudomonas TaxID=196821 RepID=UPI00129A96EB|nr:MULTISPECIES: HIT family protein [unclassified Pseudomonas]MDU9402364.1 HIT family protein [Pseudomonas sp. zfem004]